MDILRSGRRSLRHTNAAHPVHTLRSGDLACPGVGMQLLFRADMPALVASAERRPGRGATTLDEEQEVTKCDIVVGARRASWHTVHEYGYPADGVKTFADGTLAQRPFQALHPRPASPASAMARSVPRTPRAHLAGVISGGGRVIDAPSSSYGSDHHNLAIPGACPPLGQAPRQNASSARLDTFERHRTHRALPRCVRAPLVSRETYAPTPPARTTPITHDGGGFAQR